MTMRYLLLILSISMISAVYAQDTVPLGKGQFRLGVHADDSCSVWVDGVYVGRIAGEGVLYSIQRTGRHRIRAVESASGEVWNGDITVPRSMAGHDTMYYTVMRPPVIIQSSLPNPPAEHNSPDMSWVSDTTSAYYSGGKEQMQRFIAEHIQYPKYEKTNGNEGMVIVKIWIDTTGAVIAEELQNFVSAGLNLEAMRVARLLRFKPARDKANHPIISTEEIYVRFVL